MSKVMDERAAGIIRNSDMHDDLLSTSWAATYIGVNPSTIRHWKRRGHLTPAGADEFGRPLYRGIDVLRAEATAASNAARTQADNLATRRASHTP